MCECICFYLSKDGQLFNKDYYYCCDRKVNVMDHSSTSHYHPFEANV